MMVQIYTDGGSRGNPGHGASAFIARAGDPLKVIARRSRYIGRCTNNQAEYNALILALEWAGSREVEGVRMHSDSELMVRQVQGIYKVRSEKIKPLHRKVMALLKDKKWSIVHQKRDHEWISGCDSMVNKVLDERI
ncbi:MAG: ribonuclease HI family protein [Candidatus Thermoplasmatota archaeon]|nr:ribonuclease HI family protein [Candidatus Thermoplasmatota archaeon]